MAVQYAKVVGVVLTYLVISVSMIFANKYLVGTSESEKDLSIFVAWFQCCVTVCFVTFTRIASRVTRPASPADSQFSLSDHVTCMKHVIPLTITFVGMLTFNNLCLKYVGVAFFQVARSMTLVFTVIFSILILHQKISLRVMLCCLCVAGGFVLGVDQEHLKGTLSVRGVTYGVVTSLFVSLNGIFIKKSLDMVERDSVRLTYYNNINAVVLFLPVLYLSGQLTDFFSTSSSVDPWFWLFLCFTGIMSFGMAWISAVQIDLLSPVTHHIIANSKAVIQTLIAVVAAHEQKALLWWFSVVMVVGGATSYALVRLREDEKKKRLLLASSLNGDVEQPPPNGRAVPVSDVPHNKASYDFSSTRDTNLGLGNTLSNGHIGNSSNNNNSWQQLPSLETISLVASNEQKGAKTDDATSRENAKLLDPPAETRQW